MLYQSGMWEGRCKMNIKFGMPTLIDLLTILFEKYNDEYIESLITFREQCTKAIGGHNIKICIENCGGYKSFALKGIEILLRIERLI